MEQVGRPVRRKEGRAKVTGEALYVDDVTQAGMIAMPVNVLVIDAQW